MRKRVVVTGVGIVSPLGVGSSRVWSRLTAGACGIRRVDALQGLPAEIAAAVPRDGDGCFDAASCRLIERGDDKSIAPFAQFALVAAAEALDDAAWAPSSEAERCATGVAIGSGIGALADIVDAADALRERGHRRVSPYFIPRMLVNMAAGQVSIRAGLRGPMAAPATACATGAHALADARQLIASGEADVMLAGGAEACIDPLAVAGFSRLRALSTQFNDTPEMASRPFDGARDGFVLGEGAAVLVLESLDHALKRGAPRILAELSGVGLSADANHITAPLEDGDGALRAMRAALRSAAANDGGSGGGGDVGAVLSTLDHVNAHATSTPVGDGAELRAISKLATERGDGSSSSSSSSSGNNNAPPLLVTSTKGATGHLLGAAGAIEAAFTCLSLHHQAVPPTINLEAADPDGLPGVQLVTAKVAEEYAASGRPLRAALCNSFGFGGVNASLLFTRWV